MNTCYGEMEKNELHGNHFDKDFLCFFSGLISHVVSGTITHKGHYWSNDIDYKSQVPVASISKITSFKRRKI